MGKIYVDTDKLNDDSQQVKELAAKLDQLLTNYVTRMQKVPNETKEWQGNSAEAFVNIIKDDYKTDYTYLISTIRKYANELKFASDDYKSVVQENVL
jgi:uncharacterized protein YukE